MMARIAGACALLAAAVTCPCWAAEPTTRASALDRVSWIAGCWEQDQAGHVVQEQWMRPLGKTMVGMGRTVAGDKTVFFEYLRIEEREGNLVYIASPSGQRQAEFVQAELTDDAVLFENPGHDYPQRIRYTRQPDGSLIAQTEGEQAGKQRVEKFPFRRVGCDGGGPSPASP